MGEGRCRAGLWPGRRSGVAQPGHDGPTGNISDAGAGPVAGSAISAPPRAKTVVTGTDGISQRRCGCIPSTFTDAIRSTGTNTMSRHAVAPSTVPSAQSLVLRGVLRAGLLGGGSTRVARAPGVSCGAREPSGSPSRVAMKRTSASARAADSSKLRSRRSTVSASRSCAAIRS